MDIDMDASVIVIHVVDIVVQDENMKLKRAEMKPDHIYITPDKEYMCLFLVSNETYSLYVTLHDCRFYFTNCEYGTVAEIISLI
jgi:hypothetical protein